MMTTMTMTSSVLTASLLDLWQDKLISHNNKPEYNTTTHFTIDKYKIKYKKLKILS